MPRILAAILLVAVLAIGGGPHRHDGLPGRSQHRRHDRAGGTSAVVTPVVVPAYGYGFGWHPFGFGFGSSGSSAALFFLFIVFALIRAIFWRGGPGRRGGWGPGGWGGLATGTSGHGVALGVPRARHLRRLASPGPRRAPRPDRDDAARPTGQSGLTRLALSPLPAPPDARPGALPALRCDR